MVKRDWLDSEEMERLLDRVCQAREHAARYLSDESMQLFDRIKDELKSEIRANIGQIVDES